MLTYHLLDTVNGCATESASIGSAWGSAYVRRYRHGLDIVHVGVVIQGNSVCEINTGGSELAAVEFTQHPFRTLA